MILNIFLIVIGFLTSVIGIWNIFVGSYIWGTLFGLGGIWSIWLGTLYIIQEREEEKKRKVQAQNQSELPETSGLPSEEGIFSQDLFNVSEEMSQLIPIEHNQEHFKDSEINPDNQNVIRLDEFIEDPSDVSLNIILEDEQNEAESQNPGTAVEETTEVNELYKQISE